MHVQTWRRPKWERKKKRSFGGLGIYLVPTRSFGIHDALSNHCRELRRKFYARRRYKLTRSRQHPHVCIILGGTVRTSAVLHWLLLRRPHVSGRHSSRIAIPNAPHPLQRPTRANRFGLQEYIVSRHTPLALQKVHGLVALVSRHTPVVAFLLGVRSAGPKCPVPSGCRSSLISFPLCPSHYSFSLSLSLFGVRLVAHRASFPGYILLSWAIGLKQWPTPRLTKLNSPGFLRRN